MNLIEELQWRGLLQDMTPNTQEQLQKEMTTGYVGFDPTADSLHIGNLVPVTLLVHLQRAGHKPIVLVGGATGRVGDPSGKSEERQLLSVDQIEYNLEAQKKQLRRFLNFDSGANAAEVVNNYTWFSDFTFLDFIRDVGKHITVNYMMAKDSVKNRLDGGMSFTEFSYQLIQGYDFYHLLTEKNCKLQMGGSDQWGNITTGIELVRRLGGGEACGLTAPLIKKADGTKFGKSEGGNVWLDRNKTSPYKFYQFWLNSTDEDVERYIKVFSLKPKAEIEALIAAHQKEPHLRVLQRDLAAEMTARVHSEEDLLAAREASEILFGKSTADALRKLSVDDFQDIFQGVQQTEISLAQLSAEIDIVSFLSETTGFLSSKGEARRALKENSIYVNKTRVSEDYVVGRSDMIRDRFILLQRGKKNYFVVSIA